MHSITMSLVSTLLAAASTAAYILANPATAPNALFPRADFTGGFAIYAVTCPTNTKSCGSLYNVCCPVGTTCAAGENPGCCPDGDNCFSELRSLPVCADPNWTLYKGRYSWKFFCCPADQTGLLPDNGQDGQCARRNQVVPATKSATKYVTAEPTRLVALPTLSSSSVPPIRATASASSAAVAFTAPSSSEPTPDASPPATERNSAAASSATASAEDNLIAASSRNAGLMLHATSVHIAIAALGAVLGGALFAF